MTVFILPGRHVYHLFRDHLPAGIQGRLLAYANLPLDTIPLSDLRRCIDCERRRIAASPRVSSEVVEEAVGT